MTDVNQRFIDTSNYVDYTSNIVMTNVNQRFIDTSNYVDYTCNIVMTNVNQRFIDTSNYVDYTCNIIMTDVNKKFIDTSNYVDYTCNIVMKDVMGKQDKITAGTLLSFTGNTLNSTLAAGTLLSFDGNTLKSTLQAGTGLAFDGNTLNSTLSAGALLSFTGNTLNSTLAAGYGLAFDGNKLNSVWSNINTTDIYFKNGKVGIGTDNTTQNYALNVNGGINVTDDFYINGQQLVKSPWVEVDNLITSPAFPFKYKNVTITKDDDTNYVSVGIGITNPVNDLRIHNQANLPPSLKMTRPDDTVGLTIMAAGFGANKDTIFENSGAMEFRTDYTLGDPSSYHQMLYLSKDGRVGIGTTVINTWHKVTINGSLNVEGELWFNNIRYSTKRSFNVDPAAPANPDTVKISGTSNIINETGNAGFLYFKDGGEETVAQVKSVSYTELTNVPATFTPSTHSHTFENITGLDTAFINVSNFVRAESNVLRGLINTKQNLLSAGTGISITGNTISGFDGNYNSLTNKLTAGTGISIVNNTITGFDGNYNSLTNKLTAGTGISITGNAISGFDGNYNSLTNKLTAGNGINIYGNSVSVKIPPLAPPSGNYLYIDGSGYLTPAIDPNYQAFIDCSNYVRAESNVLRGLINTKQNNITPGTGLSFSGATLNSVWTATGNHIYNNNTGCVGIGTNDPIDNFHIHRPGTNSVGMRLTNDSTTIGTGADGIMFALESTTNNLLIYNYEASSILLGTSGAAQLTINSSGNVGIGTSTNITNKLQVNGTCSATTLAGAYNPTGLSSAVPVSKGGTGKSTLTASRLLGSISGGTTFDEIALGTNLSFDTTTTPYKLNATGGSGTDTRWTTVNTNDIYLTNTAGKVGIGTNNPQQKLHLEDGSMFIGDIATTGATNSTTANGYRLIFDNSFNGTAGSGTNCNKIVLHNNTGGGGWMAGFGLENSGVSYQSGGNHRFYTLTTTSSYGTERLTILSTGNVGIGTATPSAKLNIYEATGTVAGANAGSIILDHDNSGGASSITFRSKVNRGSDYGYIQYQDSSSVGGAGESAKLIIGTQNDADDDVCLMPSGRVGVNNSSPTYKLDVNGDIHASGWCRSSTGFYSQVKDTYFEGNNGNTAQYGTWQIRGSTIGGWGGIRFTDPDITLMVGNGTTKRCGFHYNGVGWGIYCDENRNTSLYGNLSIAGTMYRGNTYLQDGLLSFTNNSYTTGEVRFGIGGWQTYPGGRIIQYASQYANSAIGMIGGHNIMALEVLNNYSTVSYGITGLWIRDYQGYTARCGINMPPDNSYILKVNGACYNTTGVWNSSDIRIKNNIEDIKDDDALQKISAIEPKIYNYIDIQERGTNKVYGFIAQQIKEVIPEAVKLCKETIPSIYKYAPCSSNIIYLDKDIDTSKLDINTVLTLCDTSNLERKKTYSIQSVEINDSNISVTVDRCIECIENSSNVFVYGIDVDDFHALDKSYIYTLNVCATQELHRIIMRQNDIINKLSDRIACLENSHV